MRKYRIRFVNSFRKDFRLAVKRGCDISKLETVVDMIASGEKLPREYRDHELKGKGYKGCRECRIEPDWLLVYRIMEKELILELLYTGTHSDLFK